MRSSDKEERKCAYVVALRRAIQPVIASGFDGSGDAVADKPQRPPVHKGAQCRSNRLHQPRCGAQPGSAAGFGASFAAHAGSHRAAWTGGAGQRMGVAALSPSGDRRDARGRGGAADRADLDLAPAAGVLGGAGRSARAWRHDGVAVRFRLAFLVCHCRTRGARAMAGHSRLAGHGQAVLPVRRRARVLPAPALRPWGRTRASRCAWGDHRARRPAARRPHHDRGLSADVRRGRHRHHGALDRGARAGVSGRTARDGAQKLAARRCAAAPVDGMQRRAVDPQPREP